MKLQWSKKYIAMGLVAFLVVAASILFLLFLLKIDVVLSAMSKVKPCPSLLFFSLSFQTEEKRTGNEAEKSFFRRS